MSPDENNIPQGRKGGLVGGPARARALWGVGYDGVTFDSGWHGGHDESN